MMSWPSKVLALAGLMALSAPVGATSDNPCARLFVPEGYQLSCSLQSDPDLAGWALVVRPAEGTFAPLSELTIRPIDEPVDDPAQWLRDQLTLDMSSFDATLDDLLHGADSPLANTPIIDQLESWRGLLHAVAGWPLSGCADPQSLAADASWRMSCDWQLGPFRQYVALRLLTRGDQRYAVKIRAMNEHRMRHLVAIANSF